MLSQDNGWNWEQIILANFFEASNSFWECHPERESKDLAVSPTHISARCFDSLRRGCGCGSLSMTREGYFHHKHRCRKANRSSPNVILSECEPSVRGERESKDLAVGTALSPGD